MILLAALLFFSLGPNILAATSSSLRIPAGGTIDPFGVYVTINRNQIVGRNNLSLGFMLDQEWRYWINSPTQQELAQNSSFKLVRVFDWKASSPRPCVWWYDGNRSGIFNWTSIDLLVSRIFEIGAEPMFCLGGFSNSVFSAPQGMNIDLITGLPNPASWAAYCKEWVQHFSEKGLPVRFYEIVNEPYFYFGWVNYTRLQNYVDLWNNASRQMRQINPNVMISHDSIMFTQVLDYWLIHGDDVDFLDFHKYDCYTTSGQSYYDDQTMFSRAETRFFDSIEQAQTKWIQSRGKALPVIDSESGFNSAWENGTDPRIQSMSGAIWTALMLRTSVLKGLSYSVYYSFQSSATFGKNTLTGGAGFGMVNGDNDKPWYPYFVNWMLGSNLSPGDPIIYTNVSGSQITSLGWIHNNATTMLLISRTNQTSNIYLAQLSNSVHYSRIDQEIPWQNATVQTGILETRYPLAVSGYSVILVSSTY